MFILMLLLIIFISLNSLNFEIVYLSCCIDLQFDFI